MPKPILTTDTLDINKLEDAHEAIQQAISDLDSAKDRFANLQKNSQANSEELEQVEKIIKEKEDHLNTVKGSLPLHFICPLDFELLTNPIKILTADKKQFRVINKEALDDWESTHGTSFSHPLTTGVTVKRKDLNETVCKETKQAVEALIQDINNHDPQMIATQYPDLKVRAQLYTPKQLAEHYQLNLAELKNYYSLQTLKNAYTLQDLSKAYSVRELAAVYSLPDLINSYPLQELSTVYSFTELADNFTIEALAEVYPPKVLAKHFNYGIAELKTIYPLEKLVTAYKAAKLKDFYDRNELNRYFDDNFIGIIYGDDVVIREEPIPQDRIAHVPMRTVYIDRQSRENSNLSYYARLVSLGHYTMTNDGNSSKIALQIEISEQKDDTPSRVISCNLASNARQRFVFSNQPNAKFKQNQLTISSFSSDKEKLEEIANYNRLISSTPNDAEDKTDFIKLRAQAKQELLATKVNGIVLTSFHLAEKKAIITHQEKIAEFAAYRDKKKPANVEELAKKPETELSLEQQKYFAAARLVKRLTEQLNTVLKKDRTAHLDKTAANNFIANTKSILKNKDAQLLNKHSNAAKVIILNIVIGVIPVAGILILAGRLLATAPTEKGCRFFGETPKGQERIDELSNSVEAVQRSMSRG